MDTEYKRAMSPSLGLLTLAALTPNDHDVVIADENVERVAHTDTPDLVGITVNIDTAKRAYAIAAEYRRRGVPVILGGIHASACPDEASHYADSICIGEAEMLWESILADAANGGLAQTYFATTPTDLSLQPIPQWNDIDRSRYLYTNVLTATRGCVFRCAFCYNSCEYVHNIYRQRPLNHILAEIDAMPSRQVMFIDDNLIGDIGWAYHLARTLATRDIVWHGAVSANIGAHESLLDAFADSGCRSLFIGFESVNEPSLRAVKKRQNNVNEYETTIRRLHDRGIMVNASLAFGFDDDGPSVFADTLDWLVSNKIETMTTHILTPYPGTKLHASLAAEGRIFDTNTDHYNTAHAVFHPAQMSPAELENGYRWMYDQFYSWPNIWKRMPHDSRRVPFLLFNLAYRKFGPLTATIAKAGLMNWAGRVARRLCYGID